VIIKKSSVEESCSNLETAAWRDISLGTEEFELTVAERKELGCEKKTSFVI
jgi:hypothetical protein